MTRIANTLAYDETQWRTLCIDTTASPRSVKKTNVRRLECSFFGKPKSTTDWDEGRTGRSCRKANKERIYRRIWKTTVEIPNWN